MQIDNSSAYWAALIRQVRLSLSLSQEDFAESVFSNQATVSRWEKGIVIPSYDKQAKIEKLAMDANVASLGGLVEVIRNSPHRIILVDQHNFIIAASASSEWQDNRTVEEQLSQAAWKPFEEASLKLNAMKFWKGAGGQRADFIFHDGQRRWNSVVVSVSLRGVVYAVVQQTVT
jgi:transcriptional regulator with XRE-family HTH domain